MLILIMTIWSNFKNFVGNKAASATVALNERKWSNFLKEFGMMLVTMLIPAASAVLLLTAAYRRRRILLFLGIIFILAASYRANHSHIKITGDPVGEVDEELARQRAQEQYPTVRSLMFRVFVAVASFTIIDRKHDVREIETSSSKSEHFYMDGVVPIYQFELDLENEVTQEQADDLRDKLQEYGRKFISDYPMLISPDSGGRSALEVLTVHPLGHRICVDVVLTTAASIPIIDARRRARAERKSAPIEVPHYIDEDYGEE